MNHIFIASRNSSNLEQLHAALNADFTLNTLRDEAMNQAAILQSAIDQSPNVVLLDFDLEDTDAFEVLKSLQQHDLTKGVPVIMIACNQMDSQAAMALNKGAEDCISLPCSRLVIQARVRRACRRSPASDSTAPSSILGQMVAFMGVKGGVGTTTVAVNAAVALAARQHQVTLVDLRGFFGTMATHLGVHPSEHPHGLAELLDESPDLITPERVESLLIHHNSGIRVLLGAQQGDGYHRITGQQAGALINSLRNHAQFTLFDLPAWPTEAVETILGNCDRVLLVLEREPASLHAAQVLLNTLISHGVVHGDIAAVVVNRSVVGSPIPVEYMKQNLECPIYAMIPPSPDAFSAAARSHEPLIRFRRDLDCSAALESVAEKLTLSHAPALAF